LRSELGIPGSSVVVGLVARFDPQKDHHNFVKAASLVCKVHPGVHFLLCGDGVDHRNEELAGWIDSTGFKERFHLLGRIDDVPRVMSALDVLVSSSSFGEGFPNVVGEAMACGVPCVVTEVGDSARIVGDCGVVVPPRAPELLAEGLIRLIFVAVGRRRELGYHARRRVVGGFSLPVVANRYASLYRSLVN